MANYGSILPKDILLQLSTYLNYRDIWNLCILNKAVCYTPDLWLYKIEHELNYTSEFIKQYVYNITTKRKITLLPLNEKYMELKSRNNVDFGSEYYKSLPVLLHRASRKKDFIYARQLVKYFLSSSITLTYVDDIIIGAVSVGNIELMYDIIEKLTGERRPPLSDDIYSATIVDGIIQGYYESSTTIRDKINFLLRDFNITPTVLQEKRTAVLKGLAGGNYLEGLKRANIDPNDITLRLQIEQAALQNNSYFVINYYQIKRPVDIATIVDYIGMDAIANPLLVPIESLIENGYLEYIIQDKKRLDQFLEKLKENPMTYAVLIRMIKNNHLDMLAYFVRTFNIKFPLRAKTNIAENTDNLLPETYMYLRKNIVPELTIILANVSELNPDLREYILNMNK